MPELMTAKETAAYLRTSEVQLWRMRDKLPKPIRIGKSKKLYRLSDLNQWMDEQQKGKQDNAA